MRRRRFISLLGAAALTASTASRARADQAEECGRPVVLTDGWPVVHDGDKSVDEVALCRMCDRLARPGIANVHSVLVAHNGSLAFEHYFSGSDEVPGYLFGRRREEVAFDLGMPHDMKSVSKSVASLVVGIALDRRLIASVDQPILDFFPELSDLRSPDLHRIRLSHVLTMSMGLAWREATPATGDLDNDEARMRLSPDPCRYVLGRPVTAPAGQEFFYNTGALALVSAIIRKATGKPLDEFARTTLFEPLGISGVTWSRFNGDTDAGGGLRLRPRDMAKVGQLVLAGGRWNDRQIVPATWIAESTTPKIKAVDGLAYGYLWWLGQARHHDGRQVQWIGALGRGGQSIRVVLELDCVAVITAGYYQDYSPQAFRLLYGVFTDILRSVPRSR